MARMVTGNSDVDIWIWIIEYLAKFKKELWMLDDVFEMGPKVPDHLGEHTNEMVAFRCLAYLFDPTLGQNNNVASGAESKVEFDLSESCEYVLQCILDEILLSDLKPGAPELSKWNLLPFIEYKRLSLPKCAIELVREASCEKYTGVFPCDGQESMRFDGSNSSQVTLKLPGQNFIENMEVEGESIDQDLRNGNGVLRKEIDTSCCDKVRCDVTIPDSLEENNEVNQAPSVVDVPAGYFSRMGIPSGNMPTLSNCTTDPLVGGTSNIEVSNDNEASSDGLKSLSCSESFSDRIVTGDLDIDIWIWIIEYFAKFKKELWTLHDVFQMAPTLPHYLGDYTNEMVAFRCLAYLFDASSRQDNNVGSGAGSKVEFDLSESCEHVLQCILDEIPLSKLKPGAPELLKWNLLPFIENKRLRLPKCTFELMREASCKNSGVCPSYGEETMGTDSNKINQVAVSCENIDERMNEEGNLFDQGPEIGDGVLGDKNETSFGKTDLCDVVIPDTFEENEDGNKDTSIVNGIFCAKAKEPNLDPADATMSRFTKKKITDDEILSVKLTLPNRIYNVAECSTTKENECFDHGNNQEGIKGVRRSTAHDHGEFVVPEELRGICEADTGNGQTESSHDVNILPQEVETGITFSTDSRKLLREYPSDEECEDQEKDEYQKQKNGVYNALATNIIQYENVDGHSSSPSPCRYTCKQCKKGGKLLFCSNEGCPTTIHEKCLNSLPAYDDDGNFYCPLCAYTLHSSEFLKSKAQVGEAKKKLISFLQLVNSRQKRKGISGNQVPSSQH